MRNPNPKKHFQVQRMFGLAAPLAKQAGLETDEYIRLVVAAKTSSTTGSIKELTFDEANVVIKALGGDPFPSYGHSRRTENYRKQAAGVKSIETDAQLKLIRELGAQRHMDDSGLDKLATRMRLPWPPNTTEQGNKLVEALKAMNKRDNVAQFPEKPKAADQPAFRRVA